MRSAKFSDKELLDGLISKDINILREYYVVYFQRVRNFVCSHGGNEEDAKDIFQDAILIMFQSIRDGKYSPAKTLEYYLFATSRYLWYEELRRRHRKIQWIKDRNFDDFDDDLIQISDKNERLKVYRKCYDELPDDCRKILRLFALGLPVPKITGIMDYKNEQLTRNRRYRCMSSLIKKIKAEYEYYNKYTESYENNQALRKLSRRFPWWRGM